MKLSEEISEWTAYDGAPSWRLLKVWRERAAALETENARLRAELTPPAHEDSPLQRAFEIPPQKLRTLNILCNRARCRKCHTVIISKDTHDWVRCTCGAIFTDGGNDYIRRGGDVIAIEDLTIYG